MTLLALQRYRYVAQMSAELGEVAHTVEEVELKK